MEHTVKAPLRRSFSDHIRDSTARALDVIWKNTRDRRLAGEEGVKKHVLKYTGIISGVIFIRYVSVTPQYLPVIFFLCHVTSVLPLQWDCAGFSSYDLVIYILKSRNNGCNISLLKLCCGSLTAKHFILPLSQLLCSIGMICFSELHYRLCPSQEVCQLEYLGCAVKDYWYFLWQGAHCFKVQVSVRYARARLLKYKLSITIQLQFICSYFGLQDAKHVANHYGGQGRK